MKKYTDEYVKAVLSELKKVFERNVKKSMFKPQFGHLWDLYPYLRHDGDFILSVQLSDTNILEHKHPDLMKLGEVQTIRGVINECYDTWVRIETEDVGFAKQKATIIFE